MGRTALELNIWVYPHERTAMIAEFQRTGKVDHFETHHRTSDGRVVVGEMSGRIITVGTERLVHFTLVDVTRQRQIEQEIRDMNQALEARVQARTEKLEVANHELNQALASLAHHAGRDGALRKSSPPGFAGGGCGARDQHPMGQLRHGGQHLAARGSRNWPMRLARRVAALGDANFVDRPVAAPTF